MIDEYQMRAMIYHAAYNKGVRDMGMCIIAIALGLAGIAILLWG